MVRLILIILALALIVVIGLAVTGNLSINQTRRAQAPAFEVNVSKVELGTTTKNVQVPTVGMETKQIEVPTVTVNGGNETANQQ